jgi:PleD family two-component response regulator
MTWAERVRHCLAAGRTVWDDSDIAVTASFGVAGTSSWSVATEHLIEAADQALYEAKRRGGNVVVTASAPPGTWSQAVQSDHGAIVRQSALH